MHRGFLLFGKQDQQSARPPAHPVVSDIRANPTTRAKGAAAQDGKS